jgi:hypothetical protein
MEDVPARSQMRADWYWAAVKELGIKTKAFDSSWNGRWITEGPAQPRAFRSKAQGTTYSSPCGIIQGVEYWWIGSEFQTILKGIRIIPTPHGRDNASQVQICHMSFLKNETFPTPSSPKLPIRGTPVPYFTLYCPKASSSPSKPTLCRLVTKKTTTTTYSQIASQKLMPNGVRSRTSPHGRDPRLYRSMSLEPRG